MSKLTTAVKASVRATVTEDVTIKPALRKRLLAELRAYVEVNAEYKRLKKDREELTAKVRELREQTGSTAIEIEGFKTRDVTGTQTKFDKKKFVTLGGDLAIYDQACVVTPKRAYEKITIAGEQDDD